MDNASADCAVGLEGPPCPKLVRKSPELASAFHPKPTLATNRLPPVADIGCDGQNGLMTKARPKFRPDPEPNICSVESCDQKATIVHAEKLYCGRHALERLEADELLEAAARLEEEAQTESTTRSSRSEVTRAS